MKTWRVVLRVLLSIFSIILLVGVLAPCDPAADAQEGGLPTIERARLVAQGHMLRERVTIRSWEGAELGPAQPHYDLDGHVAAYVFSVMSDGRDAGYITVSAEDLPNPILEYSTAPARYKATRSAVRSTAAERGLMIDEQQPLYLGMLAYFYRIGDPEPVRLMEMGTQQMVTLDAAPAAHTRQQASNSLELPAIPSDAPPAEFPDSGAATRSTLYKLLYGPDYGWYRGCGPTAVANAMGHWADRGYPNLVYGGSDGDYSGTIDQLATLMGTSPEGWTWLPIDDDIRSFAALRGYSFQSSEQYSPPYEAFVSEIDAHRPIVVLVNGHVLYGNHFITGFGYEYDPSDPNSRYMIVHDTWYSTPEDFWVQFGTGYSGIWFDTVVPPVVNVDTVPPTSAVKPLPEYQTTESFLVRWSGTDVGWGIKWYDVQYRDAQDSTWVDWKTHSTATGAYFAGVKGHTYCFRSRAMDIDHNQEAYPASADTCTTLPSLAINYTTGEPGSFFALTGTAYPSSAPVTITVNGHELDVIATDPAGELGFTLDTADADEGAYVVTTSTSFDLSVVFYLGASEPYRPQEGTGTVLYVPGGIALTPHAYFPIVGR